MQETPTQPSRITTRLVMEGAESFFLPGSDVGCLLVHGFSSSPFVMRELGERLNMDGKGYTVAGPLLAGHGTSPEHLSETTWQDWVQSAEDGIAELRAHGCKRIYLAGLSLGGATVLYIASQHPDAFAGIIAMSAPVWLPRVFGQALSTASRAMPYFDKKFSDIADPNARSRHLTYQRVPLVAVSSLADMVEHLRPELSKITAPTLVIYARKDHLVHPLNSMHVYSSISSDEKRLMVLHRGYHIVTVDSDKALVFEAVEKFIAEQESLI